MRTAKRAVVLSITSLLVAAAWAGCSSNPEVNDGNQGGVNPEDGNDDDAGTDASTGGGDQGPMFPGGNGDGDGLGPGGPGNPGGNGGNDGDAAVIIPKEYPDATFSYTPPIEDAGTCADDVAGATLTKRPVDVIIVIDNSASMEGEIVAVQDRINADFAAIIGASGIDYRVIMVTRFGNVYIENHDGGGAYDSAYAVCIGTPLSDLTCPEDDMDTTPAVANNEPRFYHHSTDIGSHDMWCKLLTAFDTSDPIGTARTNWTAVGPDGWGAFLREEALKIFVGITDDNPDTNSGGTNGQCPDSTNFSDDLAGAQAFDTALLAASPEQFGTAGSRNYVWYSIVGMAGNDQTDPTPLEPSVPVETLCCQGDGDSVTCPDSFSTPASDGVNAGIGYQELSIMTGGLRYPNCYNSNFDDVFNAIAEGVIEGAVVECDFKIPDPTNLNAEVNFDDVTITYLEGGSNANTLSRVADANGCTGDDEYYLGVQGDAGGQDYNRVYLCPDACTRVQADADAEISVGFGCLGQ
jgi:hypothetical protein